jgi:hypothetical protein
MALNATEKRLHQRITANIDARFFYGNLFYSCSVLNLSEKGMFIHTRRCLPQNALFVIIFRTGDELVKVIARVKRIQNNASSCDGMGLELLNPSAEYLVFVHGIH